MKGSFGGSKLPDDLGESSLEGFRARSEAGGGMVALSLWWHAAPMFLSRKPYTFSRKFADLPDGQDLKR